MTAAPSATPLLILAGGLATRLQALAKETPKYLQPVDGNLVFADIHLRWAARQGFRRVFLSVGHLGEKIAEHCGDGTGYGLELSYLFDGERPLGTGGAVRGALKFDFSALAITYGDTLLRVPVSRFLDAFAASRRAGLMTVYRNAVPGHVCNADLRVVTTDGGRGADALITYDKKSPEPNWAFIDYGFLALRRTAIENFSDLAPFDLAAPLSRLSRADQIGGFEIKDRFWEIGSPDALDEFRRAFRTDPERLYGS